MDVGSGPGRGALDPRLLEVPAPVERLASALATPAASHVVRDVVDHDAPVRARILVLAAAMGGWPTTEHDVDLDGAVAALGPDPAIVALACAVHAAIFDPVALDLGGPWLGRRGLLAGIAAATLARTCPVDVSTAVAAALVQDVGVALFDRVQPWRYAQIRGLDHHGLLVDGEIEQFGTDHADAGGDLLDAWGSPSSLGEAVRCSHAAEPSARTDGSRLIDLVAATGPVADAVIGGRDGLAAAADHLHRLLGHDLDTSATVIAEVGLRSPTVDAVGGAGELDVTTRRELSDGGAVRRRIIGAATQAALFGRSPESTHVVDELRGTGRLDATTGLVDHDTARAIVERELVRCDAVGAACSVLLVGLDAHDELGESCVLPMVRRVAHRTRHDDLLARWDVETFLLLLPGAAVDVSERVAERIRVAAASDPVEVDGRTVPLTVSIGIATHQPGRGYDAVDALLVDADLALFRAMVDGGDRWVREQPPSRPALRGRPSR